MSRRNHFTGALLLAVGIGSSLSVGVGVACADTESGSDTTKVAAKASSSSPPASRSRTASATRPRSATPAAARQLGDDGPSATRLGANRLAVAVSAPSTTPTPGPTGVVPVALAGMTSIVGSVPVPRPATSRAAAAQATSATGTPANVTVQAETLTLTPATSGRMYTDSTASGGAALLMSTNGTATATVSTPDFTSLVIRAKGDQYRGAPSMTVRLDGAVVATQSVSATTWTDYVLAVTGAAGTHTVSIAYTNDLTGNRGRDRNLRVDSITVVAGAVAVNPSPLFPTADWLNQPIAANPALAADSATWVGYFTAAGTQRVANLYEYGVALVPGTVVTASTPRFDVTFTQPWGADPFGGFTVPIPTGTRVPPGTDGALAVQDPVTGQVYGLWQATFNATANTWTASWGGMTPIGGNGIDTSGSATATNISRYAGVVTGAELTAAIAAGTGLSHALVFSTDIAGPAFVGPATKSDGGNLAKVAVPIPEGYRIQIDPTINVDAIAGITPGEAVIAKTLQTHGAYVIDQGGARMAFSFEVLPGATAGNPGKAYTDAGFAWDYFDMAHIPWSTLRVLAA